MKLNKHHRTALLDNLKEANEAVNRSRKIMYAHAEETAAAIRDKKDDPGSAKLITKMVEMDGYYEGCHMVNEMAVASIQKLLVDNNNPDW